MIDRSFSTHPDKKDLALVSDYRRAMVGGTTGGKEGSTATGQKPPSLAGKSRLSAAQEQYPEMKGHRLLLHVYHPHIHHICTVLLYVLLVLCLFLNFYVVLAREQTVFYLRTYHAVAAILMIACSVVMLEFILRSRRLPKLDEPHEIPVPAFVGAVALTIGIALGYLYFMIFNYAFEDCDKLVDILYGSEHYLDMLYSLCMSGFALVSLFYIWQRTFYGAINSHLDKVGRLFINITFTVVWVKVVIYKGYLSHQELCQRKELEGYWCPVLKRHYICSPSDDLHGTQKIWYYMNKGLLNTAVISCASEYYPVLIVSHWLACGGAEERAEDLLRRHQLRQGMRGLMREFFKDVSRVYSSAPSMKEALPLPIHPYLKAAMWSLIPLATVASIVRWLSSFYGAIDFDETNAHHWLTADYCAIVMAVLQFALFSIAYLWARSISDDRLDAHHKAHARGDISIVFGCCVILFVKLVLQIFEYVYQHRDGFINTSDMLLKIFVLLFVQANQWLQYFALRRLLALRDADCRSARRILPLWAGAACIMAWVHFGTTFFDTSLIKYQLMDETFHFSPTALISMIFTQTIYPADYLFAFTISGCYLEVLLRYQQWGFFQVGQPHLENDEQWRERRASLLRHTGDDGSENEGFQKSATRSHDEESHQGSRRNTGPVETAIEFHQRHHKGGDYEDSPPRRLTGPTDQSVETENPATTSSDRSSNHWNGDDDDEQRIDSEGGGDGGAPLPGHEH